MQRMRSRLHVDERHRLGGLIRRAPCMILDPGGHMKKPHTKSKLTLQIDTIRHMKQLTLQDLRQVEGGSGTCSGACTSTAVDVLCAR